MRYLGGKSRLAKHIAPIIEAARKPGQQYLEPFVGGGAMIRAISGPRIGTDLCEPLITLWKAVQSGWDPPEYLGYNEWRALRWAMDAQDPKTAFAGFGCSFGAAWFQAYGRAGATNIAASVRRGLLKDAPLIKGVDFRVADYRDHQPDGWIVLCDPPYAGTTGYKAVGGTFDSAEFWATMLRWAQRNTVFVCEFSAPDDFRIEEVWSRARKVTVSATNRKSVVERLYRVHA